MSRDGLILGLNSGTSMDGVGGVIFNAIRLSPEAEIKIFGQGQYEYPRWLLREIKEVEEKPGLESLARLNFILGEFFAECANKLIKDSGIPREKIFLIGSHGQTIGHFPEVKRIGRYKIRATLQIGEPTVIAQRTGITTVSDFRPADIAGGGEGAPILGYIEYLLFQSCLKNRMVLNLGGIANFSLIPRKGLAVKIRATDCGPCNILLDGLMGFLSRGEKRFDDGGKLALKGLRREEWVKVFLRHSFFKKPAPKSTGRDDFNDEWLKRVLSKVKIDSGGGKMDLLRSGVCAVAEMVARCYFDNYRDFVLDEVVVSGGGGRNLALLEELRRNLGKGLVLSDELGIPCLSKEPIGFGILALLCIYGKVADISSRNYIGSAKRGDKMVLGKIIPGRNWTVVRSFIQRGIQEGK